MELAFGKYRVFIKLSKKASFERKYLTFSSKSWIELGKDMAVDGNFYYFQLFNLTFGFKEYDPEAFNKIINEINNAIKQSANIPKDLPIEKPKDNIFPLKPKR